MVCASDINQQIAEFEGRVNQMLAAAACQTLSDEIEQRIAELAPRGWEYLSARGIGSPPTVVIVEVLRPQ